MSKALLVAGRELRSFFSTWMGYIICAAALFIDGLLFNAFAISSTPKFSADVLADFFYFASGISIVSGVFLAMRLIAEEKQNKHYKIGFKFSSIFGCFWGTIKQ